MEHGETVKFRGGDGDAHEVSTTNTQPEDPTLTSLAAMDASTGLVEQTGADAFTKRPMGVANATDVLTRADGDGRYAAIAGSYSDEQAQDAVGDMVTGNTETGIAVTYDDALGKLNFDVQTAGDARYAPIAKGVTNGDSHDHNGGDGAQINHTTLSNIGTNTHAQIDTHIASTSNPHSVTKSQVGLVNVDNTSDVNKPVSTAQQTALDAKQNLDSDLTAVAGLSTTGLIARTGSGTASTRALTAPAAGITVSSGDGVSGNPTLALANDLSALEALSSTGIAARTATDTWAQRTITGTTNQVTVTNGDGVSGNPTLSLPQNINTTASVVFNSLEVRDGAIRSSDVSGGNTFTLGRDNLSTGKFVFQGAQTNFGNFLFKRSPSGTTDGNVEVEGSLSLVTAGQGLNVKEGTNARMGVATLVAGTVTVNTTAVTANSRIMLTGQNSSGTHGELTVSARTAGTSFVITSSSGTDTRQIAWIIFEPS